MMGETDDDRAAERRPDPADPTRREVLDRALAAGAVVWGAGVCVPAAFFLWPAAASGPGAEYAEAGSVKDFPIGSERMVQKGGKPIIVLRLGEEKFSALSAVCTHLACVVRWDAGNRHIACPCHAGFFAADGSVISGPPPRPLTPYRVVVVGDELRVY